MMSRFGHRYPACVILVALLCAVPACTRSPSQDGSVSTSQNLLINASELQNAIGKRVQILGVVAGTKGSWHLVIDDQVVMFDRAVDQQLVGRQALVIGNLEVEHLTPSSDRNAGDVIQSDSVSVERDQYVIRDFTIAPQ